MIENVVILGSWPAGYTAWIYAARANLSPVLFQWPIVWWQLTWTTQIENFPGRPGWVDAFVLMDNMKKQAENSWTKIISKTVNKVDLSTRPFKLFVWEEEIFTKSLIIATWAIAKRMTVPGAADYRQKGISACAVCDWWLPIFRNKVLVVIWGWDSAIEEALHLTHFASKVIVLVRRDEFRASKAMQNKAMNNPELDIMFNTELKDVSWDGTIIQSMTVTNNKSKAEEKIEIWWLFYAIGHIPNTTFLSRQIETDKDGYIVTVPWTTQTNIPWVFACGDVQDKLYRQAITSAWTGCVAALEAEKFLSE